MGCRTALEQPCAGLLPDQVYDFEIGRRQRRFQFVELGNEGLQFLLTPVVPVEALRMGLDIARQTL